MEVNNDSGVCAIKDNIEQSAYNQIGYCLYGSRPLDLATARIQWMKTTIKLKWMLARLTDWKITECSCKCKKVLISLKKLELRVTELQVKIQIIHHRIRK